MRVRRRTARLVRHWVSRFRGSDDETLRVYHRYAYAIYYRPEAEIIRRVCRSELRRRDEADRRAS